MLTGVQACLRPVDHLECQGRGVLGMMEGSSARQERTKKMRRGEQELFVIA